MTGSNRRHPACKAGALPAELTARERATIVYIVTTGIIIPIQGKFVKHEFKISRNISAICKKNKASERKPCNFMVTGGGIEPPIPP